MAGIEACAIFCIIASIFLVVLGSLLISEYKYIHITNISPYDAGMTCIWAAGIYMLILLLILFKYRRKNSTFNIFKSQEYEKFDDNKSDSSDEGSPFINLSIKKLA
ncbi:hypothetical protein SteCoe_15132 [Stentor coeruleus]|uniref:Uncharacterized protein n=1 Tax=Stentor coeruleus TaxID=5963 RepID=A0A1R2C482_9CILI|nr:hypothetical protein SteCoe_15132 [Stentor coeruleus]